MLLMSVTLDVSKLSGWLNADAYCRVTPRRTWRATQGKERREGVEGAVAVHAACTEKPTGHRARHA